MPSGAPSPSATSPNICTLHARHEHGGHPVRVLTSPAGTSQYEIEWPHGLVPYGSARQLLKALYNEGDTSPQARDPGMTFNRYFRLLKAEPDLGITVFDLFSDERERVLPTPPVRKAVRQPPRRKRCPSSAGRWYRAPLVAAATTLALFGTSAIAAPRTPAPRPEPIVYLWADKLPTPGQLAIQPTTVETTETGLSVGPVTPLGIDLAVRGHEVRKLMFKIFGARIARRGFDPEDVLQEIYRGLLARNKGKCPFDATKSSFGHYVCLVSRCILSNYERKMGRRSEHEQVGMYSSMSGDDPGMVDAALVAATSGHGANMVSGSLSVEEATGTVRAFDSLLSVITTTGKNDKGLMRPEAALAARALPLVYQGYQRAEIARKLGEDPGRVGRALSFLRRSANTWKLETGIA